MDGAIYDLCIVGAGMFGSAAARHASANVGVKVCLVGPDEPTVSSDYVAITYFKQISFFPSCHYFYKGAKSLIIHT